MKCPVEIRRGIKWIELAGQVVLVRGEMIALFLEEGLPEITACQRIRRLQVRGDFQFAPALRQLVPPDQRQPAAEMRQSRGIIQSDRSLEEFRGLMRLKACEVDKTGDGQQAGVVRAEPKATRLNSRNTDISRMPSSA